MIDRNLKLQAIQTAFTNMVNKGWFDVCAARDAAELLGVDFSREQDRFLHMLHCVRFADMTDDVKSEVQRILEEVLSQEAFTITVGKNLLGRPKTTQLRLA